MLVKLRGKTWVADFRINNKRYRKAIPQAKSQEEAEQFAAEMIVSLTGDCVGWLPLATQLKIRPGAVGAMSELLVSSDLLGKGYDVYRSLSQPANFDLVAVRECVFCRIEVKTAYRRGNKIKCGMRARQLPLHDIAAYVLMAERAIIYEPEIEEWFDARLP